MQDPSKELTIASVYHALESKKLLELNWGLTRKLNPESEPNWIVADNSPPDLTDKLKDGKFTIVEGGKVPANLPAWLKGSYHHSGAINNSLKYVKTRFLLILDCDFYIVRQSWINEILRYMLENDLSFFGAPWHPRHSVKFRYFPAVHSLFIDLNKVDVADLDFRPAYDDIMEKKSFKKKLINKISKVFPFIGERMRIGRSLDTGYPIYLRYANDPKHKSECIVPVFKPSLSIFNRSLDAILPDNLSIIPKKKGYFTDKGFKEIGYADTSSYGWEEFLWQGSPFGFHIRGSHKFKDDLKGKLEIVQKCFESFLSNVTVK